MQVRGILFDAGDVLYQRPQRTDAYVAELLRERGLASALSHEDLTRRRELRSEAKRGRLSPDDYWDQVLLMYGVAPQEERRALVRRINDYSDCVLPMPGAREALQGLKQRGFILGIVTDTIYPLEWKMRWLDQAGVAEFMDVVACSTALGLHKPDTAMYLTAAREAGLAPTESAFVGHDPGELEGAHRAGLVTVAVNYEPGTRADYYARSLLDLLNVPIFSQPYTGSTGQP